MVIQQRTADAKSHHRSAHPALYWCACAILIAACTVDKHSVAPGVNAVQVAAVLNPSLATQTVIVEAIHSGTAPVDTVQFDPTSPIATGFGLPIVNASVVVADTLGHAAEASEASPGVYQFSLPIVPGRRYSLQVTTPQTVVTGTTAVPLATPVPLGTIPSDTFDVTRGRLALVWNAVGRYFLAVQSPLIEYSTVLTDTTVTLTGALLNPRNELSAVFVPGFTQTVTVSAVDTNYFDWVRPSISSDASQRTHLHGGYGVFGSLVVLTARTVETVGPQAGPPTGAWTAATTAAGMPASLTLYVSAVHPGDTALSGNYRFSADVATHGILGRFSNDSLHLDLLPAWSALDTLARLDGTVSGSMMTLHVGNRSVVYTH
jgi:hypothetical protein